MSSRILFSQRKIAELAGISQQMVSYIIKGDRLPSVEMAVKLEKATGVCREGWLWPERHFNPYIPFTDVSVCSTCKNKLSRVQVANLIARDIFRKTKDFDKMVEVHMAYNGVKPKQMTFRYREVREDGYYLLNKANTDFPPLPKVFPRRESGKHWRELEKNGYFRMAWYIPEVYNSDTELLNFARRLGVYGGVFVIGDQRRLMFSILNFISPMASTDELIKESMSHITKVEEIWLADQN